MAPGNDRRAAAGRRGFSLIELLVVLALLAIATASIGLALRDPAAAQLEREGERLIALLESARAEARAGGLTVRWRAVDGGFRFEGLPRRIELPSRWLGETPQVEIEGQALQLLLGPEPLLPPQALRLRLGRQLLRISSDGLAPFQAEALEG